LKEKIVKFIKRKVEESDAQGVVIGLSGGIDSSTVLFLCVEALGKDKVFGLMMPSEINQKQDTKAAIELCENLGIRYKVVNIDSIVKCFGEQLKLDDKLVKGNLMSRIRMCILYYFANKDRLLVIGTGNKSEFLQGYFTFHGDIACDLMPIGNLYKTEVRKLAKEIGVPEKIIKKVPSAGLWEGQTDEGELGISYTELDKILPLLEKNTPIDKILQETGVDQVKVKKVMERMKKTEFKRKEIERP
jgi:NAD+ synthase